MFARVEGLKRVLDLFEDVPCMVTVGACWVEWDALHPSEGNFALKTLGSGSSVGLGVAMALPRRKVVILDGDGAVLMNMNGVATIGQLQPKNLIHIVFDNKVYEASGSIRTATAYNADLVAVAKGLGIKSAHRVDTVEAFEKQVRHAFGADGPHFIVAETKLGEGDSTFAYARLEETDNKHRFMRFLEKTEGRKLREDAIDVKLSMR
jgi:thiamine pyrophosphate-dependent acetolactate synthase large subunit-like protein